MTVSNLLTILDEEFLADSIRCWQEAFQRGDMAAFHYWAKHSASFALGIAMRIK